MKDKQSQTVKEIENELPGPIETPNLTKADPTPTPINDSHKLVSSRGFKRDLHESFGWEVHKYVRDFLLNSDDKAHKYIVFVASFLIWMVKKNPSFLHWGIYFRDWSLSVMPLFDVTSMISVSAFCLCILFALVTLIPNLKGSKKGTIYFGSVAEHDFFANYLDEIKRKDEHDVVSDILQHVHEMSKICDKKFKWLERAVWCGAVGLVSGIISVLLL